MREGDIPHEDTMNTTEAYVNGFKIVIINKPDFTVVGYTRPVNLDGSSIGVFIKELTANGQLDKLTATLPTPQQVWVCLSDEGYLGCDCRCTVCVEKTDTHDLSRFKEGELFSLQVPASDWADFEVNEEQHPTDLHRYGVYNMVGEIGYDFNSGIGLHFDNEHAWEPGKKMHFLLPVICAENNSPAH